MIDFRNTSNKKKCNITLKDGNVLFLKMPYKYILDCLFELEENLHNYQSGNKEQLNRMYELCIEIMNNNIQDKEINQDYLNKIKFDVEDIANLFIDYTNFMTGITNNPNSDCHQSQKELAEEKDGSNTIDVQQNGND